MKVRSIISLATLPLMTAGAILSANSARAADLVAPVPGGAATNVYSFNSIPGTGNGVNVAIIPGVTETFSFLPASPPNAFNYNVNSASGAFAEFLGTTGSIIPITLPSPLLGIPEVTIIDIPDVVGFLSLDGSLASNDFDLKAILAPRVTEDALGTVIVYTGIGTYRNTSGLQFDGSVRFPIIYEGLTFAQVLAQAVLPEGITSSFSATGTAFSVPEPSTVPEPATVAGLAFVGASALFIRKRKG